MLTVNHTAGPTVLLFGGHRVPRRLRGLRTVPVSTSGEPGASPPATVIDDVTAGCARVLVIGGPADLAVVLTRLLHTERLHVEIAHVTGWRAARRAPGGTARRVPLIRDETGRVLAGTAFWLPPPGAQAIEGEAIVDDTTLFDGTAAGVRIEPLPGQPGLRAAVCGPGMRPGRWVTGRAAQLGATAALVRRDGVDAARPVRRSTFYRHTEGWLRVG